MDIRSGWWHFGRIFGDFDIDFGTTPSPPRPPTSFRTLPSDYGVAPLDQASPSYSLGVTGLDPLAFLLIPPPAEPMPGSSFPISLPQPTAPRLPSNELPPSSFDPSSQNLPLSPAPEPSPSSFDPCPQNLSPPAAPHRPNETAGRSRKHACARPGCGYSCALPKDLRKHILTHSPPTIGCPNKLKGCGRVFRRQDQCARHAAKSCKYRQQ